MALADSLKRYFGLTSAPLQAGFTRSERGSRMPVCGACGAVVAFEGQATHAAWHEGGLGG